MEKFHDFIKRVFDEQYEASFGSGMLEKLEPQDYYLRREEGGRLIALLHAQQVLGNIHIKALVVDKEHQKKGLGASLLAELEEKAAEVGATSITLSTKSYQARDFYIKQGYEIYASLTDVPQKGITKYHFIKRLSLASLNRWKSIWLLFFNIHLHTFSMYVKIELKKRRTNDYQFIPRFNERRCPSSGTIFH